MVRKRSTFRSHIRMRTEYDLEMLREIGFCNGIKLFKTSIKENQANVHGALLTFPRRFSSFYR